MGQHGGRLGVMMETNYFSLHTGIRAIILSQGITNARTYDEAMERARREIASGHYIWPHYIAYGQRT